MKIFRIFADNLFVHELLHLVSGMVMFVLIYKMFGELSLGLLAFLVSLFVDTDHFLEGLIVNRLNFRLVFKAYPHIYWQKLQKMTLLLHSWELLFLILFFGNTFGQEPLALAIILPAALHYSIDSFIYSGFRKMPILLYFLSYRIYHRFDFKKLCRQD